MVVTGPASSRVLSQSHPYAPSGEGSSHPQVPSCMMFLSGTRGSWSAVGAPGHAALVGFAQFVKDFHGSLEFLPHWPSWLLCSCYAGPRGLDTAFSGSCPRPLYPSRSFFL